MTFFYDGEADALVENHPDYAERDDNGRLVMNVEDMPQGKLQNIVRAAEEALDAHSED